MSCEECDDAWIKLHDKQCDYDRLWDEAKALMTRCIKAESGWVQEQTDHQRLQEHFAELQDELEELRGQQ